MFELGPNDPLPPIKGELPALEGVRTATPLSDGERRAMPHIARVHLAYKLAELWSDYMFFCPTLLYTHAAVDLDPLAEWVYRKDCHGALFAFTVDNEVWLGVPGQFPRTVYGCERAIWPELARYLNELTVVDKLRDQVYECFLHTVLLPDPKRPSRPRDGDIWRREWETQLKPQLTIDPFPHPDAISVSLGPYPRPIALASVGVSRTDGTYYFRSGQPAQLVRAPAEATVKRLTAAAFPLRTGDVAG